jgi:hypothetical protein
MSARYSSTKLPKSKLTVYVPPCLRCAALEADLYRLAEWEFCHSQPMWSFLCDMLCPEPKAAKRGRLALEVMRWLASEESRIFGKAGA